jgi:hypothetical protein
MQPVTLYPEIEELDKEFKNFYELIVMSYNVKTDINDWTSSQLAR